MRNLMFEFDDASQTGYRLERLEVLNWGTFNNKVWRIEPCGNTALLTGANGSGKSTLVDALLTLLVPHVKRNYNQASGADRRRERDERTYMLGAYGKVKTEESYAARTQYLRTKDDYTVLLAVFGNGAVRQQVALAQFFWLADDGVKKFFVLTQHDLSIQQHFANFDTPSDLRKRLRSQGIEVYDEFVRYSKQFRKLVGLRSEKALDLFNQTVSIKEIGGLNDFVRSHMLERTNAQEQIASLRANYENLTRAHDAILKAERQVALLRPLIKEADQYEQAEQRRIDLQHAANAVPAFFAQRSIELLEHAAADTDHALTRANQRKIAAEEQLGALHRREIDLYTAINNDHAGQRLNDIDKDIQRLEERKAIKRAQEQRYSQIARQLQFQPYGAESAFNKNMEQSQHALPKLGDRLKKLIADRDTAKLESNRLDETRAQLDGELQSLRMRKSQIPAEDLRVRSGLLAALDLDEAQLPFVGELLKVRDDAHAWEGAIERVLRGFGRQLLVAEVHYQQVSEYINKTHLHGRLVFHRVSERQMSQVMRDLDPDALPHKLEIKRESSFYDWLKAELHEAYNYVCCADMARFRQEHRALTITGLIKSGRARHEKDDRHRLDDRKYYILGWDNRDKVREYEAELQRITDKCQQMAKRIEQIEQVQKEDGQRLGLLQELLRFDSFAALDWHSDAQQIAELREQRRQIEQSSDRLQQLRADLETLHEQIEQVQRERDAAAGEETNRQRDLDDYARQRADNVQRLSIFPPDALTRYIPLVTARLKGRDLTLPLIHTVEEEVRETYRNDIERERDTSTRLHNNIIRKMGDYKREYETETKDVDASIEALGEFRRMLQVVEHDDLPRYAQQFKELLDRKVVEDIVFFKGALERQEEAYRESIESLNTSLRGIDYTTATFIELGCDPARDREVIEFKQLLRACLPDVGQISTPETNEASFQHIRALIQRFEEDERWASKVTDVCNWLDFYARERNKGDDSERNYYSDSSGKSGGQKAKLAYTILASAIAYQFGLEAGTTGTQTFRFVVVDEAFSKSDEANARYAMDLFKQLNLQLLVVTPLDKTHVVEPYIAACHFVTNNAEENDSKVYNLTIAQYHEHKQRMQDGV
ncbi:MAG TPA: ATP-binding protein [Roseiflexaceae bacterium]|jgi:uncharacterized protein YPO0396|nr:ATP-binding protein [Roseiflexaceae bacterium]